MGRRHRQASGTPRRHHRRPHRHHQQRRPRLRPHAPLRPHRRRPAPAQDDLPRAWTHAEGPGPIPLRPQGQVLRDQLPHRRHQGRQLGGHRGRHRQPLRQREFAPRAGQHALLRGRRHGEDQQGRHLHRSPHHGAQGGRGRAHQRLQLPHLGHAGEGGRELDGRCARRGEARHRHQLPHRSDGEGHRRQRHRARGSDPAHRR